MLPYRELIALYGAPLTEEFAIGLSTTEKETGRLERIDYRPTEDVLMVHGTTSSMEHKWVRWGFPKAWETSERRDPWKSQPLINTKAETALDKVTWREATRRRRCLIPATGFYEWMSVNGKKYPLLFSATEPLFSMAGLWQEFTRGEATVTCVSIVTTAANDSVSDIHSRMPLVLDKQDYGDWLGSKDNSRLNSLLNSTPSPLSSRPVSTALNRGLCRDSTLLNADWSVEDVTTRQGSLW